jgi:hypothetical protein
MLFSYVPDLVVVLRIAKKNRKKIHISGKRYFFFTKLSGGADNKSYKMVLAKKLYGPNITVTNLAHGSKTEETCERKGTYKCAR